MGRARVDLVRRLVQRDGESIALTDQEERLLRLLVDAAGRPVSRAVLLAEALDFRADLKTRALDHAVTRLRKKLGDPALVQSVYGVGYRLPLARDEDLVGRDAELDALARSTARGLLLHGPGGIGKTRLARTVSGTFCAVADCMTPEQLTARVASALDASTGGLAEALAWRGAHTLVLDNLEQLDAAADALLQTWLHDAPELTVVGTSRRPHPFAQEVVALSPLSPEQVGELLERRGGPRTQLPRRLSALVAGLPLAVELLAARTRVASLQQLEERADLGLLGTETMRTSLQGTWRLLPDIDRRAFLAAASFAGGFDLPAWEAVWGEADALDRIESLVGWSLVRRADGRFELLDPVHRFARELKPTHLAQHAVYFGVFGDQRAEAARFRSEVSELRLERANLDQASAFSIGAARGLDALMAHEGAHAMRVAALGARPELGWRVADAHLRLGALERAEDLAREALAHEPGKALLTLGGVLLARGKLDEAERTFAAARDALLAEGDVCRAAGARFNAAHSKAIRGELEVAVQEARAAFDELDPDVAPALRGAVAGGLATFEMERGRLEQARSWLRRIPEGFGAVGTRLHAEYALGWFEADAGDVTSAQARFQAVCDACGPRGEAALAGDALEARGVMRALGHQIVAGLSDVERAVHLHRRSGRAEAEDRARFFVSVLEHRLDEAVPVSAQRLNGQGVEGRIARRLLSRR